MNKFYAILVNGTEFCSLITAEGVDLGEITTDLSIAEISFNSLCERFPNERYELLELYPTLLESQNKFNGL